jgi:hypothetical protein
MFSPPLTVFTAISAPARHPAPSRRDSTFENEKGKVKTAERNFCGALVRNNYKLRLDDNSKTTGLIALIMPNAKHNHY